MKRLRANESGYFFQEELLGSNREIADKSFTFERNVLSVIINLSIWINKRWLVNVSLVLRTLY